MITWGREQPFSPPIIKLFNLIGDIKMNLTFDGKYDVKLDTRAIINIERDIHNNPVNVFMEDKLPQLDILLTILYHAGKRLNKWTNINQIYDIFDTYCENGGNIATLTQFITELFMESGLLSSNDENNTEEKIDSKN